MYVPDGAVNNTVVCKETSRTVHHCIRKVVDIEEEKNRPQDRYICHINVLNGSVVYVFMCRPFVSRKFTINLVHKIFDANTVVDLSALHFTNVVFIVEVSNDVCSNTKASAFTLIISCNHCITCSACGLSGSSPV